MKSARKSNGVLIIAIGLMLGCFMTLGGSVAYFAYEAKKHLAEKQQLEEQVELVHDYLGKIEASMVTMQNYRDNIEELAKSPLQQSRSATELLEENINKFVDQYKEVSELKDKDRPIRQRLATLRDSTGQMEHTLRTLSTVLGHSKEFLGAIPSITPTTGWVSSHFGARTSPFTSRKVMHFGLDIGAKEGTPVRATADGRVIFAGYSRSYGRIVILQHAYNVRTKYAHNSRLHVRRGQRVSRGQIISEVGSTGRSTGPHLHYEVWVNNRPVNPANYLIDRIQETTLAQASEDVEMENFIRMGGMETDINPDHDAAHDMVDHTAVTDEKVVSLAEYEPTTMVASSEEQQAINWKKATGYGLISFGLLLFVVLFAYVMLLRDQKLFATGKAQQ